MSGDIVAPPVGQQASDEALAAIARGIAQADLERERRRDSVFVTLEVHAPEPLEDVTVEWVRRLMEERPEAPAAELLSAEEYARQHGVARGTVDKWLSDGLLQEAHRKTPGKKNSPWLIPADARPREAA